LSTIEGRKFYDKASRKPENINDGSQITIDYDKCVGCGMCTIVCPVGNFYLKANKAYRYKEQCEFCLACAHRCLTNAIYTSLSDKNRQAGYINKNVKVFDIIKSNKQ